MASSGQNPVQNAPFAGMHGYPTPEEIERSIRLAVDPLRDVGLRPEQFTYQTILTAGFTSTDFVKAARHVGSLLQQGVIDDMLSSAGRAGACGIPQTWGPREFTAFVKWIKGRDGAAALQSIHRKRKSRARTRPTQTTPDVDFPDSLRVQIADLSGACAQPTQAVADVDFSQLLRVQIDDLSERQKRIHQDCEAKVRDLKKKIAELEKRCEEELAGVDAAFYPASEYVEPEFADLAPVAYRLYSEAAARAGMSCLPLSDEGYMEAMRLHGEDARIAARKKWLASQDRRDGLIAFCREKIASSDPRQQTEFRNLLAILGNNMALPGKKQARGGGRK